MKNKLLILIITFSFFFIACDSNEDPIINISSVDLIGTWNVTSQTIENGSINYTVDGETISVTYSARAEDLDFTISFSENPNIITADGSYTFIVTTTFMGQTNTDEIEAVSIDGLDSGNWSLTNNTIKVTETNGDAGLLTITEYAGNILKLKAIINESETIDGETLTLSATLYVTLEK